MSIDHGIIIEDLYISAEVGAAHDPTCFGSNRRTGHPERTFE